MHSVHKSMKYVRLNWVMAYLLLHAPSSQSDDAHGWVAHPARKRVASESNAASPAMRSLNSAGKSRTSPSTMAAKRSSSFSGETMHVIELI